MVFWACVPDLNVLNALPRSQLDQSAGVSGVVDASVDVVCSLRFCLSLAPFGLPLTGESPASSLSDSLTVSGSTEGMFSPPFPSAEGMFSPPLPAAIGPAEEDDADDDDLPSVASVRRSLSTVDAAEGRRSLSTPSAGLSVFSSSSVWRSSPDLG